MGRPWLRNIDLKRRCPVNKDLGGGVVRVTPTPRQLADLQREGRPGWWNVTDPDGQIILTVWPEPDTDETWRERADRIRRAVNCHEELVQLAVECEDFVSMWHSARNGDIAPYPGGLLGRLRKALARAKGGAS
jgi:hypothetical protein